MTTAEFSFVYSEDYLIESVNRVRSRNKLRGMWLWFRYLPASFFALIGFVAIWQQDFFLGPLLIGLALLCFLSHKIDNFILKRNLSRSPLSGRNVLSNDGRSTTEKENAICKWTVFKEAALFEDGLLLTHFNNSHYWLPRASSKSENDFTSAIELIRSKLTLNKAG